MPLEARIQAAMIYIQTHPEYALRKVAHDFGIMRSTLQNRVSYGVESYQIAHESASMLLHSQEEWLVLWLLDYG